MTNSVDLDVFFDHARIALDPSIEWDELDEQLGYMEDDVYTSGHVLLEPANFARLVALWPDFYGSETFREALVDWTWMHWRHAPEDVTPYAPIYPKSFWAMNPACDNQYLVKIGESDITSYQMQSLFLTQNPMAPAFAMNLISLQDQSFFGVILSMVMQTCSTLLLRYQDQQGLHDRVGTRAARRVFLEWCNTSRFDFMQEIGEEFQKILDEEQDYFKGITDASRRMENLKRATAKNVAESFFHASYIAQASNRFDLYDTFSGRLGELFVSILSKHPISNDRGRSCTDEDFVWVYQAESGELGRLAALVGDTIWKPLLRRIL